MRKISKGILFIISAGLFLMHSTKGQHLPLYSQYMMNKFLINPAVAGSEGYTAINLTAREQWLGISYRTGGAFIVRGGVKVDKFCFGYAFDYTLSSIMKHSFGSHEFMDAIKFGDSARRYRWLIRY